MQRIQYGAYGGPEVMRLEEYEPPPPGAGEIRVRVKAAAINPVDWKVRAGVMKFMTGRSFPRAMGGDFAGVVEQVGEQVARVKVGDEVFGTASLKSAGAFAPVLVTQERLVAIKPRQMTFEQAACLPIAGVTAWRGLVEKAKVRAGQRVFVNGCVGGVGQAAVQIATALGATVAGSCSQGSVAFARRLGVRTIIDYARDDLTKFKAGFDVVFDTAGTLPLSSAFALLAKNGVMLDINPSAGKVLRGLFTSRYKAFVGATSIEKLDTVAQLASSGKLTMHIGRTASLEDSIQLLKDLEAGKRPQGRAVILFGG
jgi:NADPH:quinone reductase-like Zn-dependent oxidoreductase